MVKKSCICRDYFFFQAEDGIRDVAVTGVQTCALPISEECQAQAKNIKGQNSLGPKREEADRMLRQGGIFLFRFGRGKETLHSQNGAVKIGRASCRERV